MSHPADFDPREMNWEDGSEGLSPEQEKLQVHLSCLVDGELDEVAAAHVMVEAEDSPECQAFLEDARRFVRLHKDMADPDRLEARLAMMTGALASEGEMAADAARLDLVHRLATIFYQLGKAYVMAGVDGPAFRERVFEATVEVDDAKNAGRGFVDGVMLSGKDARTGLNWRQARHLLNGRLERIADPLEKGERLLHQALETEPEHEEARIYLAVLYVHQGKKVKAAELYRDVFDTALSEENRGHAINQLGRLYLWEDDHRKALTCWRWLTMSGLADQDDRFWMARFNIGVAYALAGDPTRSVDYFRRTIDAHPEHLVDVVRYFASGPELARAIDSQAGFTEELLARCPELFQADPLREGPGEP